ncbi:hypothetical protein DPX16_13873 [Anabarilius grahami]|uniref:Uncharacterized protein n=1 Tax=Anabarilius grahami TaxID=495550 RepID=A0A3N0XV92_ANAGA|nr:hypothetical protein DPX16_13873 [Anabarilius grahami]
MKRKRSRTASLGSVNLKLNLWPPWVNLPCHTRCQGLHSGSAARHTLGSSVQRPPDSGEKNTILSTYLQSCTPSMSISTDDAKTLSSA